MAKEKIKQEEPVGEGAPLWIISFADMTSLLMAFFVLLSTFASFCPEEEEQLHIAINATLAPFGDVLNRGLVGRSGKNTSSTGISDANISEHGSEKQTLSKSGGSLKPTDPEDFRVCNVFTTDSKNIFWGRGASISSQGKEYLEAVAQYVNRMHGRIVISETTGPQTKEDTDNELGLNRAIAASRYLMEKGLPEDTVNIAASSVQLPEGSKNRQLQITVLNEDLYK